MKTVALFYDAILMMAQEKMKKKKKTHLMHNKNAWKTYFEKKEWKWHEKKFCVRLQIIYKEKKNATTRNEVKETNNTIHSYILHIITRTIIKA